MARAGNGSSDYIHLGDVNEFGSSLAYSYSFRYRPLSASSGATLRRTVAITGGAGANLALGFSFDSTAAQFVRAAYQLTSGGYVTAQMATALSGGTYYWIGAIWDGTNLKVYLNGAEDGTVGAADLVRTDLTPKITLLALEVAGVFTQWDDGTIEEFVVWPQTALTPANMKSLHNGAHPLSIVQPGKPKVYLPIRGFDSPERDESCNTIKYNGTLNGTTQVKNGPPMRIFLNKVA